MNEGSLSIFRNYFLCYLKTFFDIFCYKMKEKSKKTKNILNDK